MRCQQCGEREAVVPLTLIANDTVEELQLCAQCAAERGIEHPPKAPDTPLGLAIAATMPTDAAPGAPVERSACPGCGMTLPDFRESGRLGCAVCYETFAPQLRDLLRRLHGATQHAGEQYALPGVEAVPAPTPASIQELRHRLRQAISAENFELAAELRDRLRQQEGAP